MLKPFNVAFLNRQAEAWRKKSKLPERQFKKLKMAKINTEIQYEKALERVEELLLKLDNQTPESSEYYFRLTLAFLSESKFCKANISSRRRAASIKSSSLAAAFICFLVFSMVFSNPSILIY